MSYKGIAEDFCNTRFFVKKGDFHALHKRDP